MRPEGGGDGRTWGVVSSPRDDCCRLPAVGPAGRAGCGAGVGVRQCQGRCAAAGVAGGGADSEVACSGLRQLAMCVGGTVAVETCAKERP